MITFCVEKFADYVQEIKSLNDEHYEEISMHREHGFKLNPQYSVYQQREDAGTLISVIGREDGKIVAYFIGFIAPGLHYSDCLTCTPDIFYVADEKRNGMVGVRLFKYVKTELGRRGVRLWLIGSKNAHDSTALFRYLGFEPFETIHAMWL